MKANMWIKTTIMLVVGGMLFISTGCAAEESDEAGDKFSYYIQLGEETCGADDGNYGGDFVKGTARFAFSGNDCQLKVTGDWKPVDDGGIDAVKGHEFPCEITMGEKKSTGKVKFTAAKETKSRKMGNSYDIEGTLSMDDGSKGKVKANLFISNKN